MILSVYSIRDSRTGFLNPTFELNDAVAMRNFRHAQTQDSILKTHASDFALYRIGEFDTDTGKIDMVFPPEVILDD